MNRTEFEEYLGKSVEIVMFDGEKVRGCLRKTQDEMFKDNANLYTPKNYYFMTADSESKICTSYLFRVSHVKRVKEC